MRKIFFSKIGLLILIAVIGVVIRFWWFPNNVYFGYDQARDAIVSQDIFKAGHLKLLGPSAGKDGLFHGPLYWYLIGPVYLLFNGDPKGVLGFISLLNISGIVLVFLLAKNLFNEKVGLFASCLYSISFSQTQYSLYFANPAAAVLTIMMYYLGWALLIFKGKKWAWILIGFGLGLSIQFEFFLIYLFFSLILMGLFFWKDVKKEFSLKFALLGFLSLGISLSTFVLSEVKFNFRTTKTLLSIFSPHGNRGGIKLATSTFWERIGQEVLYNVFGFFSNERQILAYLLFFLLVVFVVKRNKFRKPILFLLIWIGSNFFLDFFGAPQLYYVGIGISIAVILFVSFLLNSIFEKSKALSILLILVILASNIFLILKQNKKGPLMDLYVQEGMLLPDEEKVLDKIYSDAGGQMFVVNALTMPYKIKTTWAYLFNWYGKNKYGSVPFWGGEDVPGYEGKLPLPDKRGYTRYAIYEPMRGIPENLKKTFIDSENGYSTPLWKEKIGYFEVEKRIP